MTETFAPKVLKPALSPRVNVESKTEAETGLEPAAREDTLAAAPVRRNGSCRSTRTAGW
jgi:hypothetical protein